MKELKQTINTLSQIENTKLFCRQQQSAYGMPSESVLREVVMLIRSVLFPGYYGNSTVTIDTLETHIRSTIERIYVALKEQIKAGLCFYNEHQDYDCADLEVRAAEIVTTFIEQLPTIRHSMHTDIKATFNGDPAAKSYGEIIYCYPGIRAVSNHRIAHALLQLSVPILPRIISEMAHSETGIDIHSGATIGDYFTIDHGTGIVIGETAIIGDNVKIYQGVTLGAKSFPLNDKGNPIKGINRHPKIGNNVIIYANSTILGNIRIGNDAIIGGNLWIDEDVPDGVRLTQKT